MQGAAAMRASAASNDTALKRGVLGSCPAPAAHNLALQLAHFVDDVHVSAQHHGDASANKAATLCVEPNQAVTGRAAEVHVNLHTNGQMRNFSAV
jgi:hypothetical protein